MMIVRGLYRTRDSLLGDCVRVHWSGGDAAPLLPFQVYMAIGGKPGLAALPDEAACTVPNEMVEAQLIE